MLWRRGVGCDEEMASRWSGSPRSLADCEYSDLTSFSTSLLFSSMMGLTVRALLYTDVRLCSAGVESVAGKREVGLSSGLFAGEGAGLRTVVSTDARWPTLAGEDDAGSCGNAAKVDDELGCASSVGFDAESRGDASVWLRLERISLKSSAAIAATKREVD